MNVGLLHGMGVLVGWLTVVWVGATTTTPVVAVGTITCCPAAIVCATAVLRRSSWLSDGVVVGLPSEMVQASEINRIKLVANNI